MISAVEKHIKTTPSVAIYSWDEKLLAITKLENNNNFGVLLMARRRRL